MYIFTFIFITGMLISNSWSSFFNKLFYVYTLRLKACILKFKTFSEIISFWAIFTKRTRFSWKFGNRTRRQHKKEMEEWETEGQKEVPRENSCWMRLQGKHEKTDRCAALVRIQKALHGLEYSAHLLNKVRLQLCILFYPFDKTQDTCIYYPSATSILLFSIIFKHVTVSDHSFTWNKSKSWHSAQVLIWKYSFAFFVLFLVW